MISAITVKQAVVFCAVPMLAATVISFWSFRGDARIGRPLPLELSLGLVPAYTETQGSFVLHNRSSVDIQAELRGDCSCLRLPARPIVVEANSAKSVEIYLKPSMKLDAAFSGKSMESRITCKVTSGRKTNYFEMPLSYTIHQPAELLGSGVLSVVSGSHFTKSVSLRLRDDYRIDAAEIVGESDANVTFGVAEGDKCIVDLSISGTAPMQPGPITSFVRLKFDVDSRLAKSEFVELPVIFDVMSPFQLSRDDIGLKPRQAVPIAVAWATDLGDFFIAEVSANDPAVECRLISATEFEVAIVSKPSKNSGTIRVDLEVGKNDRERSHTVWANWYVSMHN